MSDEVIGGIIAAVMLSSVVGYVAFLMGRAYQEETLKRDGTKRDRRVGERRKVRP